MIPIVNEAQFRQIIKNQRFVMITFFSTTCSACRMQFKILDRIEPYYHGRAQFLKMNIEENQTYAVTHNLFAVPTTMFFKDGKLVRFKLKQGSGRTDRLTGVRDDKTLQGILNFLLSSN